MLVIYSKLGIAASDRDWIERVREAHDPQFQLIEPHFTLVFPFSDIPADELLGHMGVVAAATPRIRFRLKHLGVVRDQLGSGSHLFLLPVEGEGAIRSLHARLYSDVLAPKLHPTIPFVPHVTVGAFDQHEDAERLATSLRDVAIDGVLEAVHLAEFDGAILTELERSDLAPPTSWVGA